jgi:hypothetical protein
VDIDFIRRPTISRKAAMNGAIRKPLVMVGLSAAATFSAHSTNEIPKPFGITLNVTPCAEAAKLLGAPMKPDDNQNLELFAANPSQLYAGAQEIYASCGKTPSSKVEFVILEAKDKSKGAAAAEEAYRILASKYTMTMAVPNSDGTTAYAVFEQGGTKIEFVKSVQQSGFKIFYMSSALWESMQQRKSESTRTETQKKRDAL